jgi:hypothetical protein
MRLMRLGLGADTPASHKTLSLVASGPPSEAGGSKGQAAVSSAAEAELDHPCPLAVGASDL